MRSITDSVGATESVTISVGAADDIEPVTLRDVYAALRILIAQGEDKADDAAELSEQQSRALLLTVLTLIAAMLGLALDAAAAAGTP